MWWLRSLGRVSRRTLPLSLAPLLWRYCMWKTDSQTSQSLSAHHTHTPMIDTSSSILCLGKGGEKRWDCSDWPSDGSMLARAGGGASARPITAWSADSAPAASYINPPTAWPKLCLCLYEKFCPFHDRVADVNHPSIRFCFHESTFLPIMHMT